MYWTIPDFHGKFRNRNFWSSIQHHWNMLCWCIFLSNKLNRKKLRFNFSHTQIYIVCLQFRSTFISHLGSSFKHNFESFLTIIRSCILIMPKHKKFHRNILGSKPKYEEEAQVTYRHSWSPLRWRIFFIPPRSAPLWTFSHAYKTLKRLYCATILAYNINEANIPYLLEYFE